MKNVEETPQWSGLPSLIDTDRYPLDEPGSAQWPLLAAPCHRDDRSDGAVHPPSDSDRAPPGPRCARSVDPETEAPAPARRLLSGRPIELRIVSEDSVLIERNAPLRLEVRRNPGPFGNPVTQRPSPRAFGRDAA